MNRIIGSACHRISPEGECLWIFEKKGRELRNDGSDKTDPFQRGWDDIPVEMGGRGNERLKGTAMGGGERKMEGFGFLNWAEGTNGVMYEDR